MKYEAKAVSTTDTTTGLTTPNTGSNTIANNTTATTAANNRAIASVASGFPIVNISQTTAASYCSTAGASLITNAEWMTIARNIEAQLSNWTTGTAASSAIPTGLDPLDTSGLYRGHSDFNPSTALAAGADNDGYIGTNDSEFSIERRTHTLSNEEIIWDLGGNVYEWTNDSILGKDQPTGNPVGFGWRQYSTGLTNSITNFGTLSRDLIGPSNNTWNSTQNMGPIYSDGTSTNTISYGFVRGGRWDNTTFTGVFALYLYITPTISNYRIGFRCVVR
jgi:formylglycine-generating enzyme required for sulfatase activity